MQAQPDYRADVDGLRAVAVLAVLLFHAKAPGFSGGYVGVDIFFVISGFVIANSIRRDLDAGEFTVWRFYGRRARRILPALTVVLLATLAFAIIAMPPSYFEPFAGSFVSAVLFVSNLHFWFDSSYFGGDLGFRPLLHTWSLAVEEQYYILAPLFLFAVHRYLRRRWGLAIVPVMAASLGLGVWMVINIRFDAGFYLLPGRAWELLLGALLALSPPQRLRGRIASEAVSLAGIALIVASVAFYDRATPFPGYAALAPCLGAAALIWSGSFAEQSAVSRVLSWKPVVGVGLISYSLYLIHWPVLVLAPFALMRDLTVHETVLAIAVCFALAALMYRFVEQPFRRAGARLPVVLGTAAAAIVLTAVAGVAAPAANQAVFAQASLQNTRPGWDELDDVFRTGECLLYAGQTPRDWGADRCVRTPGPGEDILLTGDSFAAHYVPGLEALAETVNGRIIQYTMQGCVPIDSFDDWRWPACRDFMAELPGVASRLGIRKVVLAGSWLEYGGEKSLTIGPALKALRDLGVEVTVIGQSPVFRVPPYAVAEIQRRAGERDISLDIGGVAPAFNRRLAQLAAENGATFIDPIPALCNGTVCPVRIGGQDIFMDYGHFSFTGSARAVQAYFPYIAK